MIEDGNLPLPPSAIKANNDSNPLGIHFISLEEEYLDPINLILPSSTPRMSSPEYICGIWDDNEDDVYITNIAIPPWTLPSSSFTQQKPQDPTLEIQHLTRSGRVYQNPPNNNTPPSSLISHLT